MSWMAHPRLLTSLAAVSVALALGFAPLAGMATQAQGFTIPQSLVLRADRIIE